MLDLARTGLHLVGRVHVRQQLYRLEENLPAVIQPAWRPVLDGELGERARRLARGIALELACRPRAPSALGYGCAGDALLYAYIRASTSEECFDAALDGVVARIAGSLGDPATAGLFDGLAGTAWTIDHVCDAEDGEDDFIELALHDAVREWRGDHDVISGLAGLSVYAFERPRRPRRRALLEAILEALAAQAVDRGDATVWLMDPARLTEHERAASRVGCGNCGLAHGVPGVIAALAGAAAVGVGRDLAARLCERAVRWLLRCEHPEGFPLAAPVEPCAGFTSRASRPTWCYGDPGVAIALLHAGRALGRDEWIAAATRIASRAADVSVEDSGVVDACLCHGATGTALVFHRFYQATGDAVFAAAARRWYTHALELHREGVGIGGFRVWADGCWSDSPGFLSGAAGVALGLLAAATAIEPAWDRVLMLSLPECESA